MNKQKLKTAYYNFAKLFWWIIIIIYSYIYMEYMPRDTFGTSQFNEIFLAINFLVGFKLLLDLGDLIKKWVGLIHLSP